MKNTQSQGNGPVHQTVAGGFEFKSGGKTVAVEFTDQRLSPHAGSATFWGWLRPSGWVERLAAALPHPVPCSNNHLTPLAKALAFCHGFLCEARKFTNAAGGDAFGRKSSARCPTAMQSKTNPSLRAEIRLSLHRSG